MALIPLVLKNGATPAVDKTFSPIQEQPIAIWKDKTTGIAVGMPAVSISTSLASSKRTSNKWNVRVTLPVMEVAAPNGLGGYQAPAKVAYNLLADVSIVAPDRSTDVQRKDLIAYCAAVLATDLVKGMVADLNPAS